MRSKKTVLGVLMSTLFMQLIFVGCAFAQEKHSDEGGEENGKQFKINQTFEDVRRGVQMTLVYDAKKDAFVGKVKNVTSKTISDVRVEVHLSNGVELGPTKREDLSAGKSRKIQLSAEGNKFNTWSTHAESGNEEGHGAEGEDEGESHESREKGEHGERKERKGEHGSKESKEEHGSKEGDRD